MKIQHHEDYRVRRRSEYPASGDQLDAVYKMATALRDSGVQLPADTLAWLDQVAAVKAKYPKVPLPREGGV